MCALRNTGMRKPKAFRKKYPKQKNSGAETIKIK